MTETNTHNNNQTKITNLRSHLLTQSQNAKLMSKLACLLHEQSIASQQHHPEVVVLYQEEAISLARKSVSISNDKAYTHATLSRVSNCHNEKMEALQCAIRLFSKQQTKDMSVLTGALTRLLVEPRQEETKHWRRRKRSNTTLTMHPSKRELDAGELTLYRQIKESLIDAWRDECCCSSSKKPTNEYYLCLIEYRLGLLFRKMNRQLSRRHFEKVVEILIDKDEKLGQKARFWLATFEGDENDDSSISIMNRITIDRCPEDYITSLYSTFATNFDDLLVNKLHYQTPSKLRHLIDTILPKTTKTTKKWSKGVDLGCGTGLSGMAFRDCIHHWTGVDVSPEMIDKANTKNCYDILCVDELERFLMNHPMTFDFVLASDVFVYIGDLESVFRAVRKSMIDDTTTTGIFAFSTEWLKEEEGGGGNEERPYLLQASARFAHKFSYIKRIAKKCGFVEYEMKVDVIRKNNGIDVMGILCVFGVVVS